MVQTSGAGQDKAEADDTFGKYAGFLESESFEKSRKNATAYLVEGSGQPSVFMISMPFDEKRGGITATIKHVRYSGTTESIMGIFRSGDGPYDDIHVYEPVDGIVKHTRTIKWRDGNVTDEPVGQSSGLSKVVLRNSTPDHGDGDDCHVCSDICGIVIGGGGCSVSALLYCSALCLPFGNLSCGIICGLLWIAYCLWFSYLSCIQICGPKPVGFGYCSG